MKTEYIKKPTAADFRRPQVVTLAVEVLACRAMAATLRDAVDKIGQALLETTHPLTDENGERITTTRFAWRAYSGDGWTAWHDAGVDEQLKQRLRPEGLDRAFCPALMAEEQTRQAEHRLIDEAGKPFGVTHTLLMNGADGMANREKWLELCLSLSLSKKGDAR
jgi:hypothetical protein